MKSVTRALLTVAIIQIVSTVVGFVTLLFTPESYAPMLDGTAFEGRNVLAAILLGIVVGGFQWIAAASHWFYRRWMPLAHTTAGVVMVGWIAGECLVLDSFIWPHAVWGGLGIVQLLLVLTLLGALQPYGQPRNVGEPVPSHTSA